MAFSPAQLAAIGVARKVGVPADLFLGLIQQESNFKKNARSPAGALGYTQLMPGTAAGLGVNPLIPQQNLLGGARYLKAQLSRFKNPALALSAYNSGPGGSESSGRVESFGETQRYVPAVLANRARYARLLGGGGGVAGGEQPPSRAPRVITPLAPAMSQYTRPNARRNMLLQGLAAGEDIYDLISRLPSIQNEAVPAPAPMRSAPMPSRGRQRPPVASQGVLRAEGTSVGGPIEELIYDPKGSIFNGVRSTKPYGGHPRHVHYAAKTPEQMLAAIRLAGQLGLGVGENPYADTVDPVHTKGSWHYQTFPGLYNGRRLGKAADISGDPVKMARLFDLLSR